eukprot:GHVS01081163.1.p1 GENE.GHVS01081163.1~~GHVS01081163.1.p1  ORF type:complete len:739 (+),score=16.12 GHVS01081163.1:115-2217(+)
MVYAVGGAVCLFWLFFDVPLTAYSLFIACRANSGTSVAIQWLAYCMTLAGKIGTFFFWPKHGDMANVGIAAELVLFMTPIINVLLVHRARTGPGGMFVTPKEQLSVEGLLHYDVMTNVALDLLDLSVGYAVSRRSVFVQDNAMWLHMFLGVVLVNGFFCLSLTVPSTSAADKKSNVTSSDIFLTAKHATITALFFIDVPLLFYRMYCLSLRPSNGVDLFVFKNVFCIPCRSFRLHQSRLAEREKSKGSQRAFYDGEVRQPADPTKAGARDTSSHAGGRRPADLYGGPEELLMRRGVESEKVTNSILSSRLVVAHLRKRCERVDTPTNRVIKDLRSVRKIPVKGFSWGSVFCRLFRCLSIGGRRTYSVLLDEEAHESHWRQLRLLAPMLVAWCSQVMIIALQWYQLKHDNSTFDSRKWSKLSIYDLWSFGICLSNVAIFFICFFETAPLPEVAFVSLLWALRLLSFFLSVSTSLVPRNEKWMARVVSVWTWSIQPAVGFFSVLPVMMDTFIGSRYVTSCPFVSDNFKPARVSNTSALLFLLCRHQFAPISYHKLLIGPDLIKSVKLIEALSQACWRDCMIVFVIKCWCLLSSFSVMSLAVSIAHFTFLLIYITFAQSVRQIRLRTYEIRFMFANCLRRRKNGSAATAGIGEIPSEDKIGRGSSYDCAPRSRKSYLTLMDLDIKHLEGGFFSSPGTVLPSFM